MEIRYDRDLRHNYMVLCGVTAGDSHGMKMLGACTPEGLLPCSIRDINGEIYLYYEIDSRQSIRNRFAGSCMSAADLEGLLRAVVRLADTLEEYLLDMDSVLFSPDHVYADMRKERFYFAYCPVPASDRRDTDGAFSEFAASLLELIDPDDEEAAVMAYSLCGMADTGSAPVAEMARTVINEAREEKEKNAKEEEAVAAPADMYAECADPVRERPGNTDYEAVLAAMDEKELLPAPKKKKGPVIMGIVSAVVFAGDLVVRRTLYLNRVEKTLSLVVAGLCLVMTTVSFLLILKGTEKERGDDPQKEQGSVAGNAERRAVHIEEAVLSGSYPSSPGRRVADASRFPERADTGGAPEEDLQTTVLDTAAAGNVSKLYGRNGEETINISLERLPFTVGKLAGVTDHVINEPSVSRMHVRFSGDGSGQATKMQDLNSTNGTWLNGRRLKPNETVDIRPGDEIGLGRLLFEFR